MKFVIFFQSPNEGALSEYKVIRSSEDNDNDDDDDWDFVRRQF